MRDNCPKEGDRLTLNQWWERQIDYYTNGIWKEGKQLCTGKDFYLWSLIGIKDLNRLITLLDK